MNKTITFSKIVWDTDGQPIGDLPKIATLPITDPEFDAENEGADMLSDKFGFCVKSFEYKINAPAPQNNH